jgi:hypothetical protein
MGHIGQIRHMGLMRARAEVDRVLYYADVAAAPKAFGAPGRTPSSAKATDGRQPYLRARRMLNGARLTPGARRKGTSALPFAHVRRRWLTV